MNKRKIIADIPDSKKKKQTSNSNTTCKTSPSTQNSNSISRKSHPRIIQNFRLVWLDSSNDDSINTVTKLREVVIAVKKFIDVDGCMDFITELMSKMKRYL
jgi:hypothetical protein